MQISRQRISQLLLAQLITVFEWYVTILVWLGRPLY